MKKILIVVAHPDDESLGAGGFIGVESKKTDTHIRVLVLSSGVGSRNGLESSRETEERLAALKKACQILGVDEFSCMNFPDNKFDTVPLLEIIKVVEDVGNEYRPDVVLTHSNSDLNIDHQICARAVLTAFRPGCLYSPRCILGFFVPSSTDWGTVMNNTFIPRYFVGISTDDLNLKIQACEAYSKEMRLSPHPRSSSNIRAVAKSTGALAGYHLAEGLEIYRILD